MQLGRIELVRLSADQRGTSVEADVESRAAFDPGAREEKMNRRGCSGGNCGKRESRPSNEFVSLMHGIKQMLVVLLACRHRDARPSSPE